MSFQMLRIALEHIEMTYFRSILEMFDNCIMQFGFTEFLECVLPLGF